MASNVKWVRLGDYIIQRREKNDSNELPIYGVTRDGFIPPKQKDADTSKYNVFYLNDFVFNPARMEINSIYLNDFCPKAICSSLYEIFYIKDTNVLLPLFLHLFLKRDEFARHCEYIGWGSAREYCRVGDISDIEIPLPSLSEQHKVVNVWKACREIKEQNEAKAAPLMQLCQSYIQELKHKYPTQEIGPYINRIDERNTDNKIKEVRSVSVSKEFNETNAKVDKNNLSGYKIVRENQISFVQTTGNEKCLCAAINHLGFPIVVTSVNEVFETDEDFLLADFLHMVFRRKETDRYARFHSWGSAREIFTWEDMKRFSIPLPPLDVQRAIVNIYKCANEAKQIAAEADKLSREVCPALLQHIINS
jgi:type I restriction enzyme S subunit